MDFENFTEKQSCMKNQRNLKFSIHIEKPIVNIKRSQHISNSQQNTFSIKEILFLSIFGTSIFIFENIENINLLTVSIFKNFNKIINEFNPEKEFLPDSKKIIVQNPPKMEVLSSCQQLIRTIKNNNVRKTKLLITSKNINCRDKYGNTPLHIAALKGNVKIIDLLLGIKTTTQKVPLYMDMAKLDIKNKKGDTFLHILVQNKLYPNWELIGLLRRAEIQSIVNLQNVQGNTPLHILAQAGNITLIKELLNYGAVMEIQNKEGNTFLHTIACNWNKNDVEDIVWHLYENRKKNLQKIINIPNHQGNTVLHLTNMVQAYWASDMLMEIGADDFILNHKGYTPYDLRVYVGEYLHLSKKCQVNSRDS